MTSSSSQSLIFGIIVVHCLSFQMVLSAPLFATASSSASQNKKFIPLPAINYPIIEEMEMFKRDFEEPIFIDPLEEQEGDQFPVLYNLPRTDRKNLFSNYFENNNDNNQMFQFNGENPFENLPIDLRSIPSSSASLLSADNNDNVEREEELSPPSQKEFLGPIVVGPQTKSTQTNSAKKN